MFPSGVHGEHHPFLEKAMYGGGKVPSAIEWGQLPAVAVDTNVATMLLNGALQFQIKHL